MKKVITISGIVLLIAVFAFPAFGRWGRGPHMMGYGDGGSGRCGQFESGYSDLTREQKDQMNELDQKFWDEMSALRNDMWKKSDEMRRLLNSDNPDQTKLKAVQKEISDLRGKMDEMHLSYELDARKIVPEGDVSTGYGRGRMRGYGSHMGYGRGRGMMRSGEREYGKGPGMMGPQSGYRSKAPQTIEEGDVKAMLEDYLRSTNNPNLKLGKIEEKESTYLAEIVTKDGSLVDKITIDKNTGWMRSTY